MTDNEFSPITQAVFDGKPKEVERLVNNAVEQSHDSNQVLDELIAGIREVGDLFGTGEYFLPELMIGAKAMKTGLAIIEPELAKQSTPSQRQSKGRILLGTVKGDLHDIGRNLVALMLDVNGYDVHDLGVDISTEQFLAEAERNQVDIIGMSSLLTTTAPSMRDLIDTIEESGLRDRYLVIVGGAATSQSFASEVGADGWAEDASDAVKLVDNLIASRQR